MTLPKAVLTEIQEAVLGAVRDARPYAVPGQVAVNLGHRPGCVQRALDALTRRNFVTPIEGYAGRECVYVATAKGRAW